MLVRLPSDLLKDTTHKVYIAKSQLTKSNQTKTKMENLARELQKVSLTGGSPHGYSLTPGLGQ
jgi:hypothetical protein